MAWVDKFKPHYLINVSCENCGKKASVRIKKGTTVHEAVKNREIKCEFCSCQITPKRYTTPWIK